MKKINQYKRTYYREQGAILGLVLVFVIFGLPVLFGNGSDSYTREPEALSPRVVCFDAYTAEVTQYASGTPVSKINKEATQDCYVGTDAYLDKLIKSQTVEAKILKYFPVHGKEFVAIAKAESKLKMNVTGYNCFYNSKAIYKNGELTHATGTVVYTERVPDSYSTSCKKVDRSYAWSIDCGILQMNTLEKKCPRETVDAHLQRAADFSRVRGKEAWSTYNNGKFEEHLANN